MLQISPHCRPPFGQLLRELRIAANLSQEALAERARVSVACIGVLERGVRRKPRRETLALLASALDLSAQDGARFLAAALRNPQARPLATNAGHHAPVGNHPMAAAHVLAERTNERTGNLETLEDRMPWFEPRVDFTDARKCGLGDKVEPDENADFQTLSFVELVAAALGTAIRYYGVEPNGAASTAHVDRKLLIVLDNFEHVLGAAAQVTQRISERLSTRAAARRES